MDIAGLGREKLARWGQGAIVHFCGCPGEDHGGGGWEEGWGVGGSVQSTVW